MELCNFSIYFFLSALTKLIFLVQQILILDNGIVYSLITILAREAFLRCFRLLPQPAPQ